ncbi:Predicted PurR-regulated permease PerM [Methylocapsa palsarum]|uniref:Predicted PurR-regulated permease PerM n=1 Tax=Methylocapsa palsarum TaxID=1612308 RepID=A0A1I4A6L9_9HYPH|nr:Predicted PurR-regulated permease PerM [Methylocapsa palsarum]
MPEISGKHTRENPSPSTDPETSVTEERTETFSYRQLNKSFIELAVHIGFIGLLVSWTFVLIHPFIPIIMWSVVLTVALYPLFDWLAALLRGRRGLAAALMTVLGLLVVIGPVTWLGLGLIDGLKSLIEQLDSGKLSIPPPSQSVRDWPFIGQQVYEFWTLASTNIRSAVTYLVPELKPLGQILLDMASNAGTWTLTFLVAVIISGFLFSPGPLLVAAIKKLAHKIDAAHGERFVKLSGATIRAVSRGVIGTSLLQAIVGGIGMAVAGVPGGSLLTLAILVLGIIQIGPVMVVAPLLVWSWTTMPTTHALAFTACMAVVSFIDNFLKPFVLARGLTTPTLVTLIGVIGGVLAHGIVGLFVGPVVLAVAWDLLNAWIGESKASV